MHKLPALVEIANWGYLVTLHHIFSRPLLCSCVTLLTCVVNVLVAHAPKLPDGMLAQQQAGQTVDTLQTICGTMCRLHSLPACTQPACIPAAYPAWT